VDKRNIPPIPGVELRCLGRPTRCQYRIASYCLFCNIYVLVTCCAFPLYSPFRRYLVSSTGETSKISHTMNSRYN
jgi:hypothetical protein